MRRQKSNMEPPIQKELFREEPPVYRPLVLELTTQIETSMEIGSWVSGQEFKTGGNLRNLNFRNFSKIPNQTLDKSTNGQIERDMAKIEVSQVNDQ